MADRRDSTGKNIVNLSKTIRPYALEMLVAMISALLKQGSVIGAAAITSYIAGNVLSGNGIPEARLFVTLLVLCILIRAAAYFSEMYFAHDVAFRVIRNFRLSIYNKLSEIAPAYTLRKQTGQIGQAFVADVEILELFLAHTFSSFIIAALLTLIIVIVLLFINPVFSVLVLMASLLLIGVPYAVRKRAEEEGAKVREALADGNALMVESVQGLREIVMLGASRRRVDRVYDTMSRLYKEQYRYGKLKGREAFLIQMICGAFTAAVMITAAILVSNGSMERVMYPVAVMLSTVILGPVLELTSVAQELGMVFAASNRVQALLGEEPVVKDEGRIEYSKDSGGASGAEIKANALGIEFKNVTFGYTGADETVLHDVSFTIEAGETVVLVGHSGAGKSTVANLLLRYWDPDEGSIMIDGHDLREYKISGLREMISAASQDTYLFHTSVRDNIAMGISSGLNASVEVPNEEQITEAAGQANADEFIKALPNGYDTVVGERGYRLSGGEKQRIAIARTLLRDTPIVILDESVSNLDAENELYIQHILKEQLHDNTVIMIAHRLSTIVSADKVIMLEDGRVVDIGSHRELLERCSEYEQLIHNQLTETGPVHA